MRRQTFHFTVRMYQSLLHTGIIMMHCISWRLSYHCLAKIINKRGKGAHQPYVVNSPFINDSYICTVPGTMYLMIATGTRVLYSVILHTLYAYEGQQLHAHVLLHIKASTGVRVPG